MNRAVDNFYDDLADSYHLMFEDWHHSVRIQAAVLGPILERSTGKESPWVLDCACGIGTQTIGLLERGHRLVASDLSAAAVARAQTETGKRNLKARFYVADMRNLRSVEERGFDAVLAADNAIPHLLTQPDLQRAANAIASKLNDGGVLLATIRDYDQLLLTRPTMQPPAFYGEEGARRFVHQVWQWGGEQYTLHLYLTEQGTDGWRVNHFVSTYRALRRKDLEQTLRVAGFAEIRWIEPQESSFYQPIVIARKGGGSH